MVLAPHKGAKTRVKAQQTRDDRAPKGSAPAETPADTETS